MIKEICLVLTQQLASLPAHIPANVDGLVKSRISYQFAAQYEGANLYFDHVPAEQRCEYSGTYTYTSDSIVIQPSQGETLFSKSLLLGLTGVIDGIKIDFPLTLSPKLAGPTLKEAPLQNSPWAYGIVSAVALGLIGILAKNNASASKGNPTNSAPTSALTPVKVRVF